LSGLKYAHENGCPWDYNTTFNACGELTLECLKYAVEHGCPIEIDNCIDEVKELMQYNEFIKKGKKILKYLKALRKVLEEETQRRLQEPISTIANRLKEKDRLRYGFLPLSNQQYIRMANLIYAERRVPTKVQGERASRRVIPHDVDTVFVEQGNRRRPSTPPPSYSPPPRYSSTYIKM
jgi:hypothetical protein